MNSLSKPRALFFLLAHCAVNTLFFSSLFCCLHRLCHARISFFFISIHLAINWPTNCVYSLPVGPSLIFLWWFLQKKNSVYSNPDSQKTNPLQKPHTHVICIKFGDTHGSKGMWKKVTGPESRNRYRWSLQDMCKRSTTVMWPSRSRQGVGENVNIKVELRKQRAYKNLLDDDGTEASVTNQSFNEAAGGQREDEMNTLRRNSLWVSCDIKETLTSNSSWELWIRLVHFLHSHHPQHRNSSHLWAKAGAY